MAHGLSGVYPPTAWRIYEKAFIRSHELWSGVSGPHYAGSHQRG